MQSQYFPVQLDKMGAQFEFLKVQDATKHFSNIDGDDVVVTGQRHNHPGGAYGFRFEHKGKVLVICTDIEHGDEIDPRVVELSRGADLLVHETHELGIHHAEVAEVLAEHWKLPEVLAVPIGKHHGPPEVQDTSLRRMTEVIWLAGGRLKARGSFQSLLDQYVGNRRIDVRFHDPSDGWQLERTLRQCDGIRDWRKHPDQSPRTSGCD